MPISDIGLHYTVLVLNGILVIVSFIAGVITYKQVKTTRNRSLRAFVISWFSWTLAYITNFIAVGFQSFNIEGWEFVVISGLLFQVLGVFLLILFIDDNTRSRVSILKITTISIIGSLYAILPISSDEIEYNYISIYKLNGFSRLVQTAFGAFYFLLYLIWIIRMWKDSPGSTKKSISSLLLVFTSSSIFGIIGFVSSTIENWLMVFLYLFHLGAILSIAVAISYNPSIINILPFVANRLIVINKHSGVPLYEHSWIQEDTLELSPLIHGIQKISEEKFRVGGIKSINLAEGLLMIENSEKITYALLTTKSTKYLELCFRNFVKEFEKRLSQKNIDFGGIVDTVDFSFGDELVKDYFKYIPLRKLNNS